MLQSFACNGLLITGWIASKGSFGKFAKFWALLRIEILCGFCAIFLKEGRVDLP